MPDTYASDGIRFSYPDDWELDEQRSREQLVVTVSSPETAFWMLALHFDQPEPEDVLASILEAFQDEYDDVDVYPSSEKLCDQPTLARDVDFVCHELVSSAFVRVFCTEDFTAGLLYQAYDRELESAGPVLRAITQSLECDGQRPASLM